MAQPMTCQCVPPTEPDAHPVKKNEHLVGHIGTSHQLAIRLEKLNRRPVDSESHPKAIDE
jgi:hypothetical protein